MARGARRFVEHYPIDTLGPGDVLIGNHAYEISGHLNDITVVTPIVHRDRLVGLVANCCHVADIGGRGLGTETFDVYEEEELVRVIRGNVRRPDLFFGDLHAMVVANDTGVKRLGALLDEFALPDLEDLGRAIMDRTERAMRAAISDVPRGVYEHEMTVDGYDRPLTLRCRIDVREDEVAVDFAGSSPQSRWGPEQRGQLPRRGRHRRACGAPAQARPGRGRHEPLQPHVPGRGARRPALQRQLHERASCKRRPHASTAAAPAV